MLTITARKNAAKAAIDRAIRSALRSGASRHGKTRQAFLGLLEVARCRSLILSPHRQGGRVEISGHCTLVGGLLALASHRAEWLREPDDWVPVGSNARAQFSSLASHLVARYPVPAFLSSVWLKGQKGAARRQQQWYLHIGKGQNIRKADLPVQYTKKMAHHFLEAPDHFSVEQALRWGQILGLGGSPALALAIGRSRLTRSFCSEEFWGTVVQFLVNHPELELSKINHVVEYLHHERFVPEEVRIGAEETVVLGPPQPNLSMKGRTATSLLRQADEWQERLNRPKKIVALAWPPSGVGSFEYTEVDAAGRLQTWTIRELTSAEALRQEGEAMQHCVATYIASCARRLSSIWSMRFERGGRSFRVMTIEVYLETRSICEASRRGNAPPNEKSLRVLRAWAQKEGLELPEWIMGPVAIA